MLASSVLLAWFHRVTESGRVSVGVEGAGPKAVGSGSYERSKEPFSRIPAG